MKKLITILSAIGISATSASLVVACSEDVVTHSVVIGPTSTLNQVKVGQTASVEVFVSGENVALNAVSSDLSIATVSVVGHKLSVTGVKTGSIEITLSAEGAANVAITVNVIAATSAGE